MLLTEESKIEWNYSCNSQFLEGHALLSTKLFQRAIMTWVPPLKIWLVQRNDWHVSFTDPTTSDVISVIILASAWFEPLVLNILLNV